MLSDQSCDCREGIHIPDTAGFPVTLEYPTFSHKIKQLLCQFEFFAEVRP